jgi:hypothetical protein
MRRQSAVRRLARRWGWVLVGVLGALGLILGGTTLRGAHATQPVRSDGRIASYVKVTTTDGTYLRNELQLAGDARIYVLDKRQFHPQLPDELYANGKVTIWVDQGTLNVVAITVYDANDINPARSTTDSYDYPDQSLQSGQLTGGVVGGLGAALLIVALVWMVRGRRQPLEPEYDFEDKRVPAAASRDRPRGDSRRRRPQMTPGWVGLNEVGHAPERSSRNSLAERPHARQPGAGASGARPPAQDWGASEAWRGLPPLDSPGSPAGHGPPPDAVPGYGQLGPASGGARREWSPGGSDRTPSQQSGPFGPLPAPAAEHGGWASPSGQPPQPSGPELGPAHRPRPSAHPGQPGQPSQGERDVGHVREPEPGTGGWGPPPRR